MPNYYYKVILDELEPNISGIGFVMSNSSGNEGISEHAVTIDSVENISNLDFFSHLEKGIESEVEAEITVLTLGFMSQLRHLYRETWSHIKIQRCQKRSLINLWKGTLMRIIYLLPF